MSSNFIRVADNRRYFCFGDGRPYMPIGHNTYSEIFTVYGYESTRWPASLLEERFARLSAHGGNFLRLFIPANLQRGYFESGEMNPEEVARLDLVFELGEKYDLYFYVEFLMSQYYTSWYYHDQWLESPYNADNGGPVKFDDWAGSLPRHEAPDYMEKYLSRLRMGYSLDNEEFVEAQQAKMRWFVERYGGNPRVMCWGLSNDFPLHEELEDVIKPWLQFMSDYLREIDPYGHLVTLQMGSGTVWPDWLNECVDFTSIRAYPWTTSLIVDDALPEELKGRNPNTIALWLNKKAKEHLAYNMPAICGEYGACTIRDEDSGQWSLENRELARSRGTLYGLWSPLCSGSMPGHRWTGYDGFYPLTQEEYEWLEGVRAFCDRINWTAFNPQNVDDQVSVDNADCSVTAIADANLMIGWVWDRLWVGGPRWVEATVTLDSPPAGTARIEWVNCYDGHIMHAERVEQVPRELPVPGGLWECVALVIRSDE